MAQATADTMDRIMNKFTQSRREAAFFVFCIASYDKQLFAHGAAAIYNEEKREPERRQTYDT